jgi:hypothetical protein
MKSTWSTLKIQSGTWFNDSGVEQKILVYLRVDPESYQTASKTSIEKGMAYVSMMSE